MAYTKPEVANRRVTRYKARIERLRRQAREAPTEERRNALQREVETFERLVKEAEQDGLWKTP